MKASIFSVVLEKKKSKEYWKTSYVIDFLESIKDCWRDPCNTWFLNLEGMTRESSGDRLLSHLTHPLFFPLYFEGDLKDFSVLQVVFTCCANKDELCAVSIPRVECSLSTAYQTFSTHQSINSKLAESLVFPFPILPASLRGVCVGSLLLL